jgi:dUTP pyrophosphatase
MEEVKIKISRQNKNVVLPSKKDGDAGFDLYIDPAWFEKNCEDVIMLRKNETFMFSTGIRSIVPKEYYVQIQERGSTGVKAMKYGAGVIDSSYRGIWNIVITNCSNKTIVIYDPEKTQEKELNGVVYYPLNKAIAQFVVLPVPNTKLEKATEEEIISNTTHRGDGKLGSSGK